ncbi:MAG: hypothetical protein ABSC15_11500 [Terriglobales bacterium]|jgi:hypothetical protein
MYSKTLYGILFTLLLLATCGLASAQSEPDTKGPLVFISGNALVNIQSGAVAGASHGVGAATGSTQISKRDAVMSLSRILLKNCPRMEVTLDETAKPDYFMSLNLVARGGFLVVSEFSQLMVADGRKSLIYSEQGSTGSLAKKACKAVLADWQKHEKARR